MIKYEPIMHVLVKTHATYAGSWIFSRGLNLNAGDEGTIEFDYQSSQDGAYPQKMEAVLSKTPFLSSKQKAYISHQQ